MARGMWVAVGKKLGGTGGLLTCETKNKIIKKTKKNCDDGHGVCGWLGGRDGRGMLIWEAKQHTTHLWTDGQQLPLAVGGQQRREGCDQLAGQRRSRHRCVMVVAAVAAGVTAAVTITQIVGRWKNAHTVRGLKRQ